MLLNVQASKTNSKLDLPNTWESNEFKGQNARTEYISSINDSTNISSTLFIRLDI